MQIEVDSELNFRLGDEEATALIFLPEIQWATFSEPNIIHAY